ncbi:MULTISPECIES: FAD-dependent oxidoreductase [unclassified Variovorax]|uniref:FAD-dependent oxidoreductase n=1 Tax=unclassified Variovorax TaxID=663243 RepID=UPI00076C3F8F|nr:MULTISPECIES: FAD-dependent oxidoreductase [unclassified Variovorax]KWT65710.1 Fumarate reductase flavoprotein subunit [Variovorax sp. WDL1]PNG56737.1 Fumarate reductase flavoprotein subunit [Variovorax sp. B4]PNG58161.1 Fumarate reductase flavoprotein subunit [Variovorax sp. B2]VTV09332.1 Fumarate reductase flavoprotein subunit precursor [Variovorax sp. WDL1]
MKPGFDVLVVGGGASGLSAGIEAAAAGAHTAVLEKNAQPGGSSRLSVGSINAAGSSLQKRAGIVDTPDEHFEDMDHYMGAFASHENLALRRLLVDNAAGTLDWLMSLGLSFYGPTADPPHRHPRMHNVVPNSRAYPYYLGREARRRGVDLRLGTRVVGLLRADDGGVRGVSALVDGQTVEIEARKGVVLAAGDYSNGRDLMQRFRPELAGIPGVNPTATGDGHRMAEAFGARLVNGEVIYGPGLRFAEPARPSLVRRLPPSWLLGKLMQLSLNHLPIALFRPFVMAFMTASLGPEASLLRAGAVLVNADGRRFTDELAQPGLAIAHQPAGQAWLVFDERVAQMFSKPPHYVSTAPGVAFAYLPDYRRHRKDLYHRAGDLGALARSLGMPPDALRATLEQHNADLAAGAAGAAAGRGTLAQAPFHALGPLESRIVITDGGLAVNAVHQVLDREGAVIPRLYAAGAVGQGGALLAGNGHHICWAVTSGRRAGRFVAQGRVG